MIRTELNETLRLLPIFICTFLVIGGFILHFLIVHQITRSAVFSTKLIVSYPKKPHKSWNLKPGVIFLNNFLIGKWLCDLQFKIWCKGWDDWDRFIAKWISLWRDSGCGCITFKKETFYDLFSFELTTKNFLKYQINHNSKKRSGNTFLANSKWKEKSLKILIKLLI